VFRASPTIIPDHPDFTCTSSYTASRWSGACGKWGRIINVSTDAADHFGSQVSYGASKHALESYSRSAAGELGRYGITVNVVAPGPIQTGYLPPEGVTRAASNAPLRRVGHPDDVADVIVFFGSEQARWLTGQLLYVGGGNKMPI
jgi:3-oxoacyl-[acyl-carrier protein] reductase